MPDENDPVRARFPDYITVQEAIDLYGPKKDWWYSAINDPSIPIHGYEIPGDKRTFLSKTEIESYLQMRRKPAKGESDAG